MVFLCKKNLRALASAIPEIWIGWGTQNLKRVTWRNHAPFRDGLLSIGWD